MSDEQRAELSAADINNLPDDAFAYIEPGGKKDSDGKTTPRKLRHYPIHDKPHADDALARASAQLKDGDSDAKSIAGKALPKIKAAVAKFAKQSNSSEPEGEQRDEPTPEDYGVMAALKEAKLMIAHAKGKQLADPDLKSDPDDQAVMAAIEEADSAIDKAIIAQSKDGHEDARSASAPVVSSREWATAKRAFTSLVERPPSHTITAEVRMGEDDGAAANFAGYASTTGVPYAVRDWLGEYEETILPGAFAKTLREQGDVPLLFNHDGVPLASTSSGTSRLAEDGTGLRNEADFDRRDALTNSICVQLERGVLNKMSFSFRAIKDAWNDLYDERGVGEAALYDTSIVTYPANPTTSAELVEAFRSALGREGRSLWLADGELSMRAIILEPEGYVSVNQMRQTSGLPALEDSELADLVERSLRALAHADETVARSVGAHGRARTFLVANAMLELRAGKTLSAKNEGLLKQAVAALGAADKHHQKMANSHAEAAEKVQSVLDASQAGGDGDGASNQPPPANGNPINPQDGAGPRSLPSSVAQARKQVQALKRR